MGFGREKTTYCYFAIAASGSQLPHDSDVRMIVAKSAIVITVADDFFDMKGSLSELRSLTEAVRRYLFTKERMEDKTCKFLISNPNLLLYISTQLHYQMGCRGLVW